MGVPSVFSSRAWPGACDNLIAGIISFPNIGPENDALTLSANMNLPTPCFRKAVHSRRVKARPRKHITLGRYSALRVSYRLRGREREGEREREKSGEMKGHATTHLLNRAKPC